MYVVVTGGAGFIGANLCRRLAGEPRVRVVAFDDLSSGSPANLGGSGVELVRGDVRDTAALIEVCGGADSIVHLAAVSSVAASIAQPVRTHEVNAGGTISVLEAVRRLGVGHVVVASSSAVYGDTAVMPIHEELPPAPASPYAASKLATESYALAYSRSFDLQILALRFFNVFGPLQAADHPYAAIVPAAISAGIRGRPLTIFGDGRQTRDFVDVGTVCAVLAAAVRGRVAVRRPVNLATGTPTSVAALIETLEAVLERPISRRYQPARTGDVLHSYADTTRLRTLFPDHVPTPLPDALARTAAWFEQLPAIAAPPG